MLKLVGFCACALVAIAAYLFASNEDNAAALRSSAGYVDHGAKFGVRVGEPIQTVPDAMRRHGFIKYAHKREQGVQPCLNREYPASQALIVYVDDTWRAGTACIAYERSTARVHSLQWSYGPFRWEL
jgi:hypothetical protein